MRARVQFIKGSAAEKHPILFLFDCICFAVHHGAGDSFRLRHGYSMTSEG
jgi:hypothetical protein